MVLLILPNGVDDIKVSAEIRVPRGVFSERKVELRVVGVGLLFILDSVLEQLTESGTHFK